MSSTNPQGPFLPNYQPTPYPPASGHTCIRCGGWTPPGEVHYCPFTRPFVGTTTTLTINKEAEMNDYEMKELSELVEAVKKACRHFSQLHEVELQLRAIDFLAARFNADAKSLRDVFEGNEDA